MKNKNDILSEILQLKMDEQITFKISDIIFLFVHNWSCGDNDNFTSLELNEGFEDEKGYCLNEIIDYGTYNFKDSQEILTGLNNMLDLNI